MTQKITKAVHLKKPSLRQRKKKKDLDIDHNGVGYDVSESLSLIVG